MCSLFVRNFGLNHLLNVYRDVKEKTSQFHTCTGAQKSSKKGVITKSPLKLDIQRISG